MTTRLSESTNDRLTALFDDDTGRADNDAPWWQRKRRVLLAVGGAILITVVVASRALGSSGGSYRTADVTTQNVDATATSVATIEPVSQAAVAFPVGGTVGTVDVAAGDDVEVGQTLASLDKRSLRDDLHTAEATLAQAELSLQQALNGETATTSPGAGGSSGSAPTGGDLSTGGDAPSATGVSIQTASAETSTEIVLVAAVSTDPDIAAAQQAVLEAQQNADAAIAAADAAVANAATVCAVIGTEPDPTPEQIAACQTAITDALTAQEAVSMAQDEVSAACDALDALLEEKANEEPTTTTPPATSEPTTDQSQGETAPSGGLGSSPSVGGGASSSPSSADLVAYQKAIDAASADVAVAEQALRQATIAAPIAGTVVAVNVEAGDSVEAASTTQTIVVEGRGGYEASTLVSVDRVVDIKVGQEAIVTPDGRDGSLRGKVAYISTVPIEGSDTSSYLVVIGLDDSNAEDLRNGEIATASIVTGSAESVLAVPTSAVTATGGNHTVTVLDGDETEEVTVRVGAIGSTWTEITDGLTDGQTVVLADLSEPLPDSATSSSSTDGLPALPGGGGQAPSLPGGAGAP